MTEAQALLHRLWTKAVNTPDYNKREWQALQRFVDEAARQKKSRGVDRRKGERRRP